ncbi:gluconate 2-dehydrogenase subunit 3 family protein [Amaricoccus solimangrovi]|uniref:Gluconate 2-dehydrogenase subunit 3 family protein n=1 Tax=Amaricoccus solimangrovi TaxID=2589815 RepID=A0A501WRE5_9RHOB|nr:gluconate 2-dehydrogenase subunit 3 family protein [Amaricoccus solimangrovi]TPE50940.1 gluconate 2-dehydrogenase subunit 3 family protein [Amaricoccus solimangrovi]
MFPPSHTSRRRLLQAGAAGLALGQLGLPLHPRAAEAPPIDTYRPVFFSAPEWAFILAATGRLIPSDGDGPGAIETRVPVFIDLQLAGDFGAAADWYMEGPHQPDADPKLGYQTPLTPAEIYRGAIGTFDQWCGSTYGKVFADLSPEQQDEALATLEKNAVGASEPRVAGGAQGDVGATEGTPQTDEGGQSAQGDAGGAGGMPHPELNAGGAPAAGETLEVAILPPELRDFFTLLVQNTKEGYFADPKYGGNAGMAAWAYIGFPGARAAYSEWVTRYNEPYTLGPVSISGERA